MSLNGIRKELSAIEQVSDIIEFPQRMSEEIESLEEEIKLRRLFESNIEKAWQLIQKELIEPETKRRKERRLYKESKFDRLVNAVINAYGEESESVMVEDFQEIKEKFGKQLGRKEKNKYEDEIYRIHHNLMGLMSDNLRASMFEPQAGCDAERMVKEIDQTIRFLRENANAEGDVSILSESTVLNQKQNYREKNEDPNITRMLEGSVYASEYFQGEQVKNKEADEVYFLYPNYLKMAEKINGTLHLGIELRKDKPETLGKFIQQLGTFALKMKKTLMKKGSFE